MVKLYYISYQVDQLYADQLSAGGLIKFLIGIYLKLRLKPFLNPTPESFALATRQAGLNYHLDLQLMHVFFHLLVGG